MMESVPSWLWPLLYIPMLLHLAGIAAAVHALLTARSSQACIAWSISLVTFPYITLPLYLVLARNKFEGYRQAFRAGRLTRHGHFADLVIKPMREYPPSVKRRPLNVFENLARLPFTGKNCARLLVNADEAYPAIWEMISKAEHYVLVMFFIVSDDEAGRQLLRCLAERVQAGVRAVFVYDEFGSWWLTREYLEDMRAAGIEVHAFSSSNRLRNRLQINFRNHRKIVVVDGKVGFTGGLNIGDEHLHTSKKYGFWRDTCVAVQGPAVQGLQLVFQEDYHWASGGRMLNIPWTPQPCPDGDAAALYLSSGPADIVEVGQLYFLEMIHAAKRRLWISSPYFVPDASVLDALKLADMRGVEVRILLPHHYDMWFMWLAMLSYLPELEETTSIEVWMYPDYNHQKVVLVDDWLAAVGSSNLDNRSMRLNFEGNLVLADESFALQVQAMLEADFARSWRLNAGYVGEQGLLVKLGARICRLFDPIL
ncbi:MAG: cardiolipin synthase [Armatimonadetes bacterium]|nr:cardiolipin synthase [Armatimonadota bacterium]